MRINDLLHLIDISSSYIPEKIYSLPVLSLCHNSKHATPNSVFFCKKGALTDGHLYAHNAYSNGARIFIAERELDLPRDAAVIVTPSSSDALNRISVKFYNDPSKELKIVGITGTKGKTTVAVAAYQIALSYGINVGYIGTNGIYYNGLKFDTANTTPDVLELQKALREMADNSVKVVILEVSSQALWQERIYGLRFEACVFTNLYRDHIGGCEHPSLEHYMDSKRRLFSDYAVKKIIVNADSPESRYMTEGAMCEHIIRTSACGSPRSELYATEIMKLRRDTVPGVSFKLNIKQNRIEKTQDAFMPMPGHYSVENALLIISVCESIGIDIDHAVNALASITVSGRFETVRLRSKNDTLFVIDYAHNGASLKAVIDALREYEPKRIISLFGSVGGRTFERRRELGEVARDSSDIVIITSDNPNSESPESVISDIRKAVGETDKPIYMISDRAEAVKKAYELAEAGDIVLFAGKGHESYQLISGRRVPFSERAVLEEADLDAIINTK